MGKTDYFHFEDKQCCAINNFLARYLAICESGSGWFPSAALPCRRRRKMRSRTRATGTHSTRRQIGATGCGNWDAARD